MNSNKSCKKTICSTIYQQILALLKLPLLEIQENYTDHPRRLINYYNKDMIEKSFEIRFEQEQITLSCTFDEKDKCKDVYLFPDENKFLDDFISFVEKMYDFDYTKKQWVLPDCHIEIKAISDTPSDVCLVFIAI